MVGHPLPLMVSTSHPSGRGLGKSFPLKATTLRPVAGTVLGLALLTLGGCGHYKSDFACKGYPENASCRPTTEVYAMRHQQLTKMRTDENGAVESSVTSSASDRVAAVAGQTELQLGQPNIKPPQVVGVWIAPWRDGRNFLHEASLVYAIVEPADWTYGRRPKDIAKGGGPGGAQLFTPIMSRRLVEPQSQGRPGLNGGQPMMTAPPVNAAPAGTPTLPSPSQDPSALLRQLQQQMPSMSPTPGPVPSPYGGPPPMDPDTAAEKLQERMLEQRERMLP